MGKEKTNRKNTQTQILATLTTTSNSTSSPITSRAAGVPTSPPTNRPRADSYSVNFSNRVNLLVQILSLASDKQFYNAMFESVCKHFQVAKNISNEEGKKHYHCFVQSKNTKDINFHVFASNLIEGGFLKNDQVSLGKVAVKFLLLIIDGKKSNDITQLEDIVTLFCTMHCSSVVRIIIVTINFDQINDADEISDITSTLNNIMMTDPFALDASKKNVEVIHLGSSEAAVFDYKASQLIETIDQLSQDFIEWLPSRLSAEGYWKFLEILQNEIFKVLCTPHDKNPDWRWQLQCIAILREYILIRVPIDRAVSLDRLLAAQKQQLEPVINGYNVYYESLNSQAVERIALFGNSDWVTTFIDSQPPELLELRHSIVSLPVETHIIQLVHMGRFERAFDMDKDILPKDFFDRVILVPNDQDDLERMLTMLSMKLMQEMKIKELILINLRGNVIPPSKINLVIPVPNEKSFKEILWSEIFYKVVMNPLLGMKKESLSAINFSAIIPSILPNSANKRENLWGKAGLNRSASEPSRNRSPS